MGLQLREGVENEVPGNSRRYNFKALATMGISYRSKTSRGMALPVFMVFRR